MIGLFDAHAPQETSKDSMARLQSKFQLHSIVTKCVLATTPKSDLDLPSNWDHLHNDV